MSERLLTAGEVADMLAVRESWVREATRAGHLPHLRLGRYVRYQREAIQAWLSEQRHGPAVASRARSGSDLQSRPQRACE